MLPLPSALPWMVLIKLRNVMQRSESDLKHDGVLRTSAVGYTLLQTSFSFCTHSDTCVGNQTANASSKKLLITIEADKEACLYRI